MSIADHEIDDPCRECETCGNACDWTLCRACRADLIDQWADWTYDEASERRRA